MAVGSGRVLAGICNLVANIVRAKQVVIAIILFVACTSVSDT